MLCGLRVPSFVFIAGSSFACLRCRFIYFICVRTHMRLGKGVLHPEEGNGSFIFAQHRLGRVGGPQPLALRPPRLYMRLRVLIHRLVSRPRNWQIAIGERSCHL
ncbi:hypothetical protein OF83DRAFT_677104 [Amylostereum chailletii]|nr:hypothetical protein OF83DRAFT_677104 [Amylostereum chailletii]